MREHQQVLCPHCGKVVGRFVANTEPGAERELALAREQLARVVGEMRAIQALAQYGDGWKHLQTGDLAEHHTRLLDTIGLIAAETLKTSG